MDNNTWLEKPRASQKFEFTDHVIFRFAERFYYKSAVNLKDRIKKHRSDIIFALKEAFNKAKEEKSYLNNSNLMAYLGRTYGYDRKMDILENAEGVVFVVLHEKHRRIVITCFDEKGWNNR